MKATENWLNRSTGWKRLQGEIYEVTFNERDYIIQKNKEDYHIRGELVKLPKVNKAKKQ